MKRKSVLIITNYFPPTNHIAAFRAHSFAKYLDKEKYRVFVIASEPIENTEGFIEDSGAEINWIKANPLVRDLTVEPVKNKLLHKLISLKNRIIFWCCLDEMPSFTKNALKLSKKLISEQNVRILITSYGPFSPLLVGLSLKRTFPDLYWICDLRDELADAPSLSFIIRRQARRVADKMLALADCVTSVSKPLLEVFQTKNRNARLLEIRNGYDFDLVKDNNHFNFEKFKIVYAGSFYGATKPDNFFKALIVFREKYPEANFVFEIFGGGAIEIPSILSANVRLFARVDHSQIPSVLSGACVLLLVYPTNSRRGVYTGKLFDYLAVNRPILALVDPTDVAAELIYETNAGMACDNDDISSIVENLGRLYVMWNQHKNIQRNWELVEQHHRKIQVAKVEGILCEDVH